MRKGLTLFCDDGSELELPFKWVICSTCDGHGKSSAYLGAYTQSDMDEAGPEFMEDYMRGNYDRSCDECGGGGKVKVPDYSKITKAQRKAFIRQERDNAEVDHIQRQERLMEGGWRELDWYGR